jgi:hypothetical protein
MSDRPNHCDFFPKPERDKEMQQDQPENGLVAGRMPKAIEYAYKIGYTGNMG